MMMIMMMMIIIIIIIVMQRLTCVGHKDGESQAQMIINDSLFCTTLNIYVLMRKNEDCVKAVDFTV